MAKAPHKSVTAFQGHIDPLSNFYPVKEGIKIFGHVFPSAEHAWTSIVVSIYESLSECKIKTHINDKSRKIF